MGSTRAARVVRVARALLLRRPLLSRKAKNATSSASPPFLRTVPPRASLWDSIFGGGGEAKEEAAAKSKTEEEEEDLVLLDPGSSPLPLPDSVLSRTFLAGRSLAVAYTASKHGWSALSFHERCDFKGPSLVVAETTE